MMVFDMNMFLSKTFGREHYLKREELLALDPILAVHINSEYVEVLIIFGPSFI